MHTLGDFELHAISDGFFRLDGGAMFGIVPKPLWEKVLPPDDRNRVRLSLTALLVKTGRVNVLVDTGIGASKRSGKFLELYGVEQPPRLEESLAAAGVGPEDIDFVVLSHLHFDHAGGATVRRGEAFVPAFPKAVYVVQEGTWEEALDPNPRTRGSYMQEDFVPLREEGRVRFVRGEEELAPGVRVRRSGGHCGHHQVVELESGGRKAIYWADLLPTTRHVRPAWVMGYDLYPAEVAALKARLLERIAAERWVNVFEHDPEIAMAYVVRKEKDFAVETIERVPERPLG
jgi:glyoxylase-like metal-dependent hydrolase (beta-lactamase superfamily II)